MDASTNKHRGRYWSASASSHWPTPSGTGCSSDWYAQNTLPFMHCPAMADIDHSATAPLPQLRSLHRALSRASCYLACLGRRTQQSTRPVYCCTDRQRQNPRLCSACAPLSSWVSLYMASGGTTPVQLLVCEHIPADLLHIAHRCCHYSFCTRCYPYLPVLLMHTYPSALSRCVLYCMCLHLLRYLQ